MALKITEDCINCEVCVWECPNDAISRGANVFVIDAEKCTECEDEPPPRCVPVCAVDCIVQGEAGPASQPPG